VACRCGHHRRASPYARSPASAGAYRTTLDEGPYEGYVVKVDPSRVGADSLVYSTLIGNASGNSGIGIGVDSSGSAVVTAMTQESVNVFDPHVFVLRLDPSGSSLAFRTELSTAGLAEGLALDQAGNAYVTGETLNSLVTTPGVLQPSYPRTCCSSAFMSKLDPSGTLVYSTYLGGDVGIGIAVDQESRAYVAGATTGSEFSVTPDAAQPNYGGGPSDSFVAVVNATGTALVYSSYLGPNSDGGPGGIYVDPAHNIYVAGVTFPSFPTTPGTLQSGFGGCDVDTYVVKLAPSLQILAGAAASVSGRVGSTSVTLSFENVLQAGAVSISTSASGPSLPAGFSLGSPPVYYEVSTTASFSGAVTVCIGYTGITFDTTSGPISRTTPTSSAPVTITPRTTATSPCRP
jgi:Beta-propeller repeat